MSNDSKIPINVATANALAAQYGTPLFAYDLSAIRARAARLMDFKMPYGFDVRYAIKANPHPDILRTLSEDGIQLDASSSYEAMQLLELGVAGDRISVSSQQPAHNLAELFETGVCFVATSLHQLELFT